MTSSWTLDQAIELIRCLQVPLTKAGWFVGLAGGVLTRGVSEHDLDLIFAPLKRGDDPLSGLYDLYRALASIDMLRVRTASEMRTHWCETSKSPIDQKHVEVWVTHEGKRVDVMVLS